MAGAIFAIVAGILTLLGWKFNLPRLTDWTNTGISMFPNASLCCLFAGLAMVLLATRREAWKVTTARILAAVTLGLAGLTLMEHITGANLGIDTLIFNRAWGQRAATAPMRMGIPASSSYCLLAIALFLTTYMGRARLAATSLAVGTMMVASLSLTGYWFGADQLFGIAKFTGIALQTSLIICVLSIAVMALVPEYGVVGALGRADAGGAVFRRLLLPVILVPLVLGWLRIVGENAGLYDLQFGTAIRSLVEIILLVFLLWWTANSISWHASYAHSAESRLAAIVESSEDGIISMSLEGIIQSWNAGAERMFGYMAGEAVDRHISLIIPADRINEEAHILGRIRRGEPVAHFETVRRRKDGTTIAVSLSVSPIKTTDGRIVGASKIARDISERNQLEQEREQLLQSERAARSDAERASHLKDEFLATLSHELRTPLNAIVGWSQILSVGSDQEEMEEGLDAIRRSARAQAHLIEDLLDMSRIISGKVRLDVQSVDLSVVIEAAIDSVRPAADAKGIRLRKVLDPHAGPISGDPTRLQQVIWNLLTNSIKFTPKGGKVDIVLQRVNSHVEITVSDTGIGITAEFLPVIFERFRQVDSSTTRSYGGLGIGLSIVKQLVELHGGLVTARSEGKDKGSTFVIILPLSPVRSNESRQHPVTSKPSHFDCKGVDLAGIRVLIVDDEPDARDLVRRVLSQCGAEVLTAGSAAEGLEQVRDFRPHVLVSDIGMPGTDGYEFMRSVRNLSADEGGKIPAIALTAFARSEDRMNAMRAGYQVHVAKPIEPQELAVTVNMLKG
jgi:PAS domain S-box-containing protein